MSPLQAALWAPGEPSIKQLYEYRYKSLHEPPQAPLLALLQAICEPHYKPPCMDCNNFLKQPI